MANVAYFSSRGVLISSQPRADLEIGQQEKSRNCR
jgi:hypothetical protein